MGAVLIALVVLLVIVGGSIMGVASLLIVPLVAFIVLVGLLIWFVSRRARNKPPLR